MGDFQDEIVEDANIKTWTVTGSTPTHPEVMAFQIRRATDSVLGSSTHHTHCHIMVKLKYIVQFKELKEKWRYPTLSGGVLGTTAIYGRYP